MLAGIVLSVAALSTVPADTSLQLCIGGRAVLAREAAMPPLPLMVLLFLRQDLGALATTCPGIGRPV